MTADPTQRGDNAGNGAGPASGPLAGRKKEGRGRSAERPRPSSRRLQAGNHHRRSYRASSSLPGSPAVRRRTGAHLSCGSVSEANENRRLMTGRTGADSVEVVSRLAGIHRVPHMTSWGPWSLRCRSRGLHTGAPARPLGLAALMEFGKTGDSGDARRAHWYRRRRRTPLRRRPCVRVIGMPITTPFFHSLQRLDPRVEGHPFPEPCLPAVGDVGVSIPR